MSLSDQDFAQICPNGHVISSSLNHFPDQRRPFCEDCGEPTVTACSKCNSNILGYKYTNAGYVPYEPPNFCYNCGAPFPWTERRIRAAIELFAEEVTDEAQRAEFKESVEQMAKDTPQTPVAAKRFTRLLKGMASGTGEVLKKMVVDFVSETAKKLIKD